MYHPKFYIFYIVESTLTLYRSCFEDEICSSSSVSDFNLVCVFDYNGIRFVIVSITYAHVSWI